jgi:hypothetical protein
VSQVAPILARLSLGHECDRRVVMDLEMSKFARAATGRSESADVRICSTTSGANRQALVKYKTQFTD